MSPFYFGEMMRIDRVWIVFFALALMWGTSFLFIKQALLTLTPSLLVAMRLLIGGVGLLSILVIRRHKIPRDPRALGHFFVTGVIGVAIPFSLITWAEASPNAVDSGVIAIMHSTVPLFSIIFAGFMLRLESVTVGKMMGLIGGFVGIVLIFGGNVAGGGAAIKLFAVMCAAVLYASTTIYAKRFMTGYEPIVLATGQIVMAATFMWLWVLLFPSEAASTFNRSTWLALIWLGLFGSCLAYIAFYYLLRQWGPTQATLVTYAIPVVGVTAGVVFLNETITLPIILGSALILCGIWAVNRPTGALSRVLLKPLRELVRA